MHRDDQRQDSQGLRLRARLRALYHGASPVAVRFRYAIILIDLALIAFFIAAPLMQHHGVTFYLLDYGIAAFLAADLAARAIAHGDLKSWLKKPIAWLDLFVLATLLFPAWLFNFGFLRVLRLWTLIHSEFFWRTVGRRYDDTRVEDITRAASSLATFVFVVTGFVYTSFAGRHEGISGYVDALYFTVTSLTTTGYGDVTLPGASTTLVSGSPMSLTPATAAEAGKAAEARTPLADLGKDDPYIWMEEIEGTRALDWAKAQNARSLPVLQGDPRYADLEAKALAILNAKDRVPGVSFAGDGSLRNFWQDADHVRGIWRRTTLDSYRTAEPAWETILDIDALSKAENANWVFKGASCLPPDDTRCLITLSNGGKDAVTVREFDTTTKSFVQGGFVLPEGKQNISWVDKDNLLVAREWEPGQVTKSGYAYVVKAWKRGAPLDSAKEVFRGTPDDVSASAYALTEPDGAVAAILANRGVSFFEAETYLLTDGGPVKLPFPLKHSVQGYVSGQMLVSLEQDWAEKGLKTGDLISFDLAALKADPAKAPPTLVLRPTARQSVESVTTTRNKLVVGLLDNVKGAAMVFTHGANGWTQAGLDLPANSSIGLGSGSEKDDRIFITVTGYLTPSTYWLADAATGKLEQVKASPARFDASTHVVEQFEATSSDGVKIPYFVVRPKGVKYDGSAPTLLYAYGGFQVSMTPAYSGVMGKLWLERGGTYVVANIRGGGEFGPAWHEAALKAGRQKAYDDFFAVSQDLIARKITSPRRLGIMGGSNGGLLMGVALTQRPELYNAIVVQVPLFDMIRYSQIGAGASWVGEYGDPTIPSERAVIAKYDPYSNLKAGQKYPEVFIETSTKDDRVHPAHARKAAARLEALGYPVLYYENVDGGHAASANLAETARRQALEYIYLTRRLMD